VVLPLIAEATAARSVAFVDAVVPSAGSVSAPSESLLAFVRALPSDDHLPPWTAWWSEDAVAEILPDPELRARITAEQPRLPTDFYDHPVPVPPQWTDGRAITYVRFSEAYEHDAAEATRRSWTVRYLPGSHLYLLDHADAVAEVLLAAAEPDSGCRPSPRA
jgi:hypothetical protein